jgi:hypothetical protein
MSKMNCDLQHVAGDTILRKTKELRNTQDFFVRVQHDILAVGGLYLLNAQFVLLRTGVTTSTIV